MADLLPSAGHLPIPYVMAYDMFPLTIVKGKKGISWKKRWPGTIFYFLNMIRYMSVAPFKKLKKGSG